MIDNINKKGVRKRFNIKSYSQNEIELIYELTPFVNFQTSISFRERIYCILNNITSSNLCIECNVVPTKFGYSSNSYNKTCSTECNKKHKSKITSSHINETRWKHHEKKIKPVVSKIDRYEKAVKTRFRNNPNWFTKEQKDYITLKRNESYKINNHALKMKKIWANPILREKQSNTIKKLISEGKFTPPITNTWTHWESIYLYKGKKYKFRSSWEAAFWSHNKDLEFETLRIPYVYLGKKHTYIVDFIDRYNKITYEVKPSNKYLTKEKIKEQALIEWCNINKYSYILIDENWFKNNYSLIDFNNNEWLYDKMKSFIK